MLFSKKVKGVGIVGAGVIARERRRHLDRSAFSQW